MIKKRKVKKQIDLWDTFRLHQRQSVDLYGGPLGHALHNAWWSGYVTALCEFGTLSEKTKDECLEWCPT